ncbi:MAG: hypothetical protein ACK4ZJ_07665 [Allorhizobium sp.]
MVARVAQAALPARWVPREVARGTTLARALVLVLVMAPATPLVTVLVTTLAARSRKWWHT